MTGLVVYRVTRREYARDLAQLLDGEGGRQASGRWHVRGSPVAYFAESRALCMLERLVHLSVHPRDDHAPLVAAKLVIPKELSVPSAIRRISAEELDAQDPVWRQPGNRTCLRIGALWFNEREHYALQVPSAIVREEYNLVVNCTHPAVKDLINTGGFVTAPISVDARIAEVIDAKALQRRRTKWAM
jgi:RES domain-containing protein